MCERFPKCFSEFSPRPLKIGIREDLIAKCPDIDVKYVKLFLDFYIRNFDYQKALIEGSDRIDLEGVSRGKISAEEAVSARKRYRGIRNAHFKRKRDAAKAEQQADA